MKFFGKHAKQGWPPVWSYSSPGLLWNLKISPHGHILGECRNPEKQTAEFFCLSEKHGTPLWEKLSFREPWWIGIEGIYDSTIYFHSYRKPDMPQHLGIYAVDLESGEKMWENGEYSFLFAKDDKVFVAREGFNGMHYFTLHPSDGSLVDDLGTMSESINGMRSELNAEDLFIGYDYPSPFDTSHPEYDILHDHVKKYVSPEEVPGHLDVMYRNPILFLSWHRKVETGGEEILLEQRFLVRHTGTGEILFEDSLCGDRRQPTMDSFFTKDDLLLYIKDMHILTAHLLTDLPQQ